MQAQDPAKYYAFGSISSMKRPPMTIDGNKNNVNWRIEANWYSFLKTWAIFGKLVPKCSRRDIAHDRKIKIQTNGDLWIRSNWGSPSLLLIWCLVAKYIGIDILEIVPMKIQMTCRDMQKKVASTCRESSKNFYQEHIFTILHMYCYPELKL